MKNSFKLATLIGRFRGTKKIKTVKRRAKRLFEGIFCLEFQGIGIYAIKEPLLQIVSAFMLEINQSFAISKDVATRRLVEVFEFSTSDGKIKLFRTANTPAPLKSDEQVPSKFLEAVQF